MQLYLNRNMFIFDKIETPSLVFKCVARVFYTSCIQMCISRQRRRPNLCGRNGWIESKGAIRTWLVHW